MSAPHEGDGECAPCEGDGEGALHDRRRRDAPEARPIGGVFRERPQESERLIGTEIGGVVLLPPHALDLRAVDVLRGRRPTGRRERRQHEQHPTGL